MTSNIRVVMKTLRGDTYNLIVVDVAIVGGTTMVYVDQPMIDGPVAVAAKPPDHHATTSVPCLHYHALSQKSVPADRLESLRQELQRGAGWPVSIASMTNEKWPAAPWVGVMADINSMLAVAEAQLRLEAK